jgi:hypothetical protein
MPPINPRERDFARRQLAALFDAPERAYAIHYALQRLRRDETDLTPPVAAIAVHNVGTGEEQVFSIEAEARSAGVSLGAALPAAQLLALEYALLWRFNDFLAHHRDRLFVHWYMRDERFGFQALEARFRRALSEINAGIFGERSVAAAAGFAASPGPFPVLLPQEGRIDLALVLRHLYGIGPIGLRDLAAVNALKHSDLIEGIFEPMAFATGNHAHLALSSATKARLIAQIAGLAGDGTVRAPAASPAKRSGGAMRIFINYRREDTEAAANWLHEKLSQQFGEENVFIDTDDIPAGIDFVEYLRGQIDSCDVFLAMMGRGWATATDAQGRSRLMSEQDFVRREIRAALARGIPVIPVLVDGTPMPGEMQLPADIMPLRRRQSVDLRLREFRQDVERLVVKIREAHRIGRSVRAPGLA